MLVGRDDERAVLRASLARVGADPGPVRNGDGAPPGSHLALLGPAGAGKSRLARELTLQAGEVGVRALVGRAVPGAGPTPYRPLREALLAWTRAGGDALDDGYADALAPLLGPGPAADPPTAQVSPVFVGEALLRTLTSTSTGVVLVLEDLHWADVETASVVEYLCDNAAPTGLLVVATCRNEAPSPARDLVRRLSTRGSVRPLALGAFTPEQTAALAEDLLGRPPSPELADALHRRSEGVPLFVEELVAALRADDRLVAENGMVTAAVESLAVLPESVADSVQSRLGPLTDVDREALQTAAILGRSVDAIRLARVMAREPAEVVAALRAGTGLGLLEEDPDRAGALRFRHALLRDAVEQSAFPPDRVVIAGRALAVVLDGAQPEALTGDDLTLAFDLAARSGDRSLATRLALWAGAIAWESWALSTAESWLAQARRFADTDDEIATIDLQNLRVAATVGRLDVVMRLARGLLARAGRLSGHDELETRMRLAQALLDDEQFVVGAEQLDLARPLVDALDDPCMRTRHDLYSSVAALGGGQADRATLLAESAIAKAESDSEEDERDLVCAGLLQLGRARLPDADAARAAWTRSLELTEEYGFRLWRARMLAELATLSVPELAGHDELAVAALGAREAGAVELAQRVDLLRAELALLSGRPDQAEDHLAEAAQSAAETTVAAATRRRAAVLTALTAALRGGSAAQADGELLGPDAAAAVRAVLALAVDDLDGARQAADGIPVANPLSPAVAAVAAVASQDHDPQRCAALASGLIGRAAARAHAALRDGIRDAATAGAEVRDAVALLTTAPWFAAVLTRTTAPALIEAGAVDAMRDPLRSAVATFDGLGLAAPADACRALLRKAGVPVPRRTDVRPGVPERLASYGVTGREMDVLRLVAEGLTSREIGERLYLSPRTVEKHVERLLVKTGSGNRAALAALVGVPEVT